MFFYHVEIFRNVLVISGKAGWNMVGTTLLNGSSEVLVFEERREVYRNN